MFLVVKSLARCESSRLRGLKKKKSIREGQSRGTNERTNPRLAFRNRSVPGQVRKHMMPHHTKAAPCRRTHVRIQREFSSLTASSVRFYPSPTFSPPRASPSFPTGFTSSPPRMAQHVRPSNSPAAPVNSTSRRPGGGRRMQMRIECRQPF